MPDSTKRRVEWSALRVTLIYVVLGALWIAFSDRAVFSLVDDPETLTRIQTWKGWFFVLASGLVVYALTRSALRAFAERKKADRHARLVLDTIPSRVAWRDREGRYLGCNGAFTREVGLEDPEDVVGLEEEELPTPLETPEMAADTREVLGGGNPVLGREYVATAADDQLRWFRSSVVPLPGPGGGIMGTLHSWDDITREVEARAQLRHAQKVQELGQLTSGVAHDFNNVLSVIGANVELLMDQRLDEGEGRETVQEIREATRSAAQMVKTLLGLSRRADLEIVPTDLDALVQRLSAMFSRLLTPAYSYELSVKDGLPPALADPAMVEQAILNLITNARDAMENGGVLRVEVDEVVLPESSVGGVAGVGEDGFWAPPSPRPPAPGRYAAISVSDEGPGIPRASLPSIFQPFYTTKKRGAGTGLGLAMVQGLTEQQGGTVQVRSTPGAGTTMRILLPMTDEAIPGDGAEGRPDPGEPREDQVPATGTILVVDDQADLRRTMGRVLRRYGWEVAEAPDGLAALKALENAETQFVLVLSDLTMPRMGGLELYREMRRREIRVPFAVTSGLSELEELASDEEAAELPFIPKPWTPSELVRRIRELI